MTRDGTCKRETDCWDTQPLVRSDPMAPAVQDRNGATLMPTRDS